eukprot:scaffold2717_cov135-Skeletonema_dohrnii-CCMP3373.AAC.1
MHRRNGSALILKTAATSAACKKPTRLQLRNTPRSRCIIPWARSEGEEEKEKESSREVQSAVACASHQCRMRSGIRDLSV